MPKPTATGPTILADDTSNVETGLPLLEALTDLRRTLRADNKSPATIAVYSAGAEQLIEFLAEQGMPQTLSGVRREHLEAFFIHLQEAGRRSSTVETYFRACRRFFGWAVEKEELRDSPMARMRPPIVPEQPPDVLRPTPAGGLRCPVARHQGSARC